MAVAYARAAEFAERTGQVLSAAEQMQIEALLGEASALMRAHSADLDERLAATTTEETLVTGICIRVVARYLANPHQAAQVGTGPFTRAWAVANARGMWLTDDELADLAPPAPAGAARGVGTVRVGLAVGTAGQRRRLGRWPPC